MSIADRLYEIKEGLPSTVKLVAVSKFHPVEAIIEAYNAGQRIFAESRPQEFKAKVDELESRGICSDIEWHFIGHLQTNKLKLVLPYVTLVQSVDSEKLLDCINKWSLDNGRVTGVLLEMHIASEDSKQGFLADEIRDLVTRIIAEPERYSGIRIYGLMGMASLTDDRELIAQEFANLVDTAKSLPELEGRVSFKELSFGMSSDYKIASEMGSTMVRIGTSIFGERVY